MCEAHDNDFSKQTVTPYQESDQFQKKPLESWSVNITALIPFKNHPFELYKGQRLSDLVESVKKNGIISPIIVRKYGTDWGRYEILSGHNRVEAAKEAGLKEVPVIIKKNLTDEDALLIVTETNLIQRSFADLKHSERAITLATHYNALKQKSGYRSDLIDEIDKITSDPMGHREKTRDKISEHYGLGATTVARYLRVNNLIKALKDRLDNNEIGLRVAEALSYLKNDEQEMLEKFIKSNNQKIVIKQADEIKKLSKLRGLTEIVLKNIFKDITTSIKIKQINLNAEIYDKYFEENMSPNKIEEMIAKALEEYTQKDK